MPVAFRVSTIDAIPEDQRSLYVQKDGAYVLDIDVPVVPESDVKGLKESKEKVLSEKREQAKRLEALSEDLKLTSAQKEALGREIEEIKKSTMNEEQKAEYDAKLMRKAREDEAAKHAVTAQERDLFKNKYMTREIQAEISATAASVGAYSAQQFIGLYEGRSKMEPVLDEDGKHTGEFAPFTHCTVLEGDKRVQKYLPTKDAILAESALPENKNLIDSKFRAGGGATGGRTPQGGDMANMTSTQKIAAGLKQMGLG